MIKRFALCSVVAASFVGIALAQGPRRDGEWEVKIEREMPGVPVAIPPTTTKQCVTPADAADPQKAMPPQGRGGNSGSCKVSDYKTEGNTVSWSMACESGQGAVTGKGRFTYEQNAYTGTIAIEMPGRGTMTTKYTGKRIGDCTK